MGSIIAVSNQKGGVGKTTSVVSISAEFAAKGLKTLVIDLDPQANATSGLGIEMLGEGEDLFDAFLQKISFNSIIRQSQFENLYVAPGSRDMVAVEVEIGKTPGKELILKTGLSLLSEQFDIILIDCPPSSGLLTLNALGAADWILVPLQAEYFALEGISALLDTVHFVQSTFNPQLRMLGVFMTMFDLRTNLSNQVETEARSFFKDLIFSSKIPRSIRLSECPSHGLPISKYDPYSPGAKSYSRLTNEILERLNSENSFNLVANG